MFVTGPRISSTYRGMTISYEEAIERARTIAPVAERNAAAAEELRRLPEENVQAILDSGLMPLLRPKRFGGFEGDWLTQIDCVSEVARFCGSTGWVMAFFLTHQYFLSLFPEEAQCHVYERQPDPVILTSFVNPAGQVKVVDGGYELKGRWPFASGSDYCKWAILGGFVQGVDGSRKQLNFLLSSDQFTVDRVWNSAGLRGSGSNDVIVDGAFVPEAFTYGHEDALVGRTPGQLLHEGPMYRAPLIVNAGFPVMSSTHGIARGAYETFVSYTSSRSNVFGGASADRPEQQIAIGESKAEIDLAYLITEKLNATVMSGQPIKRDDAVRHRRDYQMIHRLQQRAVDRLFDISGARGLHADSALQRHWRDLHAIGHHAVWTAPAFQIAGRDALGLPPLPSDTYPLD